MHWENRERSKSKNQTKQNKNVTEQKEETAPPSENYTIISEETLEKFVCSGCNKYLFYENTPKTYNETISCQRCTRRNTLDIPFPLKTYEKYLIPCINRFDRNCKKLMPPSQIKQHEIKCNKIKKTSHLKCTVSGCGYEGKGCQLYHHYLTLHKEKVLKTPVFGINTVRSATFDLLFRQDNNLFLISCEVIPKSYIILVVEKLGICESMIEFSFSLKTASHFEKYKSPIVCFTAKNKKIENYAPYNFDVGRLLCYFEVKYQNYDLYEICRKDLGMIDQTNPNNDTASRNSNQTEANLIAFDLAPNNLELLQNNEQITNDTKIKTIVNSYFKSNVNRFNFPSNNDQIPCLLPINSGGTEDMDSSRILTHSIGETSSKPNLSAENNLNAQRQLDYIMSALKKNIFPKLCCANCGAYATPPVYR